MSVRIGDRLTLVEEGIEGVVTDTYFGADGSLVSCVVQLDGGEWAAVAMTMVSPRVID